MHHIPRFFNPNKHNNNNNNSNSSSNNRRKPKKLDRKNAQKNIDYQPPSSSSATTSFSDDSLDYLPPFLTSFRIQGTDDGEIGSICELLGLSGPDDLGISLDAWESRKIKSTSQVSGLGERDVRSLISPTTTEKTAERLFLETDFQDRIACTDAEKTAERLFSETDFQDRIACTDTEKTTKRLFPETHFGDRIACTDTEKTAERLFPETVFKNRIWGERDVLSDCTDKTTTERLFSETGLRERDVLIARTEKTTERLFLRSGFGEDGYGDDELDYRERVGELGEEFSDVVRVRDVKSSRGIKGVRPPVLVAPPPVSGMRIVDDDCSTWDILRSLDGGGGGEGMGFVYGCEDEDQGFDGDNNGVVSGSCSFTTSIDDDCSSTTTDPQSNISPQGRLRRLGHWDKGKLLGQGSFGSVYEGIADDGTFFAVKEVSLLDEGDKGRQSIFQLEQEISLLSKFEHENIVQYYGTKKNESTLYIFLELASKGSLFSLYQQYHLRDSQASVYTWQILQGLKYLHDRNVIHRDIKCGNILVDTYGTVKLADFGLAKATKLNDVKSCKGSPFWMAPEVVKRSEGYGLAADIWSLGCTVLEMLTGQLPYYPLDGMQAVYRIGNCEPPPVPDSLSRDARDFILQCLQVNPSSRPTAAKLLDHPFVKRQFPYPLVSASPQNPRRRL